MSIKEIKKRVKAIDECAHDYEMAHKMEDGLQRDFIKYVASPKCLCYSEVSEKAKLVLSTKDIEFERWCA